MLTLVSSFLTQPMLADGRTKSSTHLLLDLEDPIDIVVDVGTPAPPTRQSPTPSCHHYSRALSLLTWSDGVTRVSESSDGVTGVSKSSDGVTKVSK